MQIPAAILERAHHLVAEKYGTQAWLRRR
jgi:hypothetical protein